MILRFREDNNMKNKLLLNLWHALPSNPLFNPVFGLVRENHYFVFKLFKVKKVIYID